MKAVRIKINNKSKYLLRKVVNYKSKMTGCLEDELYRIYPSLSGVKNPETGKTFNEYVLGLETYTTDDLCRVLESYLDLIRIPEVVEEPVEEAVDDPGSSETEE